MEMMRQFAESVTKWPMALSSVSVSVSLVIGTLALTETVSVTRCYWGLGVNITRVCGVRGSVGSR
jgi:hypothetical protein